jgi:hypothetical protein
MARAAAAPRLAKDGPRWRIMWGDTILKRTRHLSLGEIGAGPEHEAFAAFLRDHVGGTIAGSRCTILPNSRAMEWSGRQR